MKTPTKFVGIDFGTTKTMAACYDPERGINRTLRLGRGTDEMPSSLYKTTQGELLFGDDADDEGLTDRINHVTRFKMSLGRSGPAHVGRLTGSAGALSALFLAHVKKRLEEQALHDALDSVVLTVPAIFGPAQRKELLEAAREAGFSRVDLLPEPVAAAIAYCHQFPLKDGKQRILVVDWGGGTLDLAVVNQEAGETPSIDLDFVDGRNDIGGECFDDDLWQIANNALTGVGHQSLDQQGHEHWGKYRRDLRIAKERLSARDCVKLPFVMNDGNQLSISCSRQDFDAIMSPRVKQAAELVRIICERSASRGRAPDFILLAGGTCRIPLIARMLGAATGLECRPWSEGREAIALGASIHAFNTWGERTPPRFQQGQSPNAEKRHAMAQYRGLLEAAWMDGKITSQERIFIGKRRKELGLTLDESESLQREVLGKTMIELFHENDRDAATDAGGSFHGNGLHESGISLSLLPSPLILEVLAGLPTDKFQGEEFMLHTHFVTHYVLRLEVFQKHPIPRAKLSIRSKNGPPNIIELTDLPRSQTLDFYTTDLAGRCIALGDRIELTTSCGQREILDVSEELCRRVDGMASLHQEIPLTIFMRKATFSSSFVMILHNTSRKKIEIEKFESTAGSLKSRIGIDPNQIAEIGWLEIDRNFVSNDQFSIKCTGYRDIAGTVAKI